MKRIIRRAIDIIKEEGILKLFSRVIYRLCFSMIDILKSLYYTGYIKFTAPGSDPKAAVEFAFSKCHGFIKPQQDRAEITELILIAYEKKPRIILEIGTAKGGTLFLLARAAADGAVIISIDLPGNGGGYPLWKIILYKSFASRHQNIHLIRDNSHSPLVIEQLRRILDGRGVDLLFIDGDHTYAGVKKDFELYAPFVNKGGIIALHDILMNSPKDRLEVRPFWDEIKVSYRHKEMITDMAQTQLGMGILYVD